MQRIPLTLAAAFAALSLSAACAPKQRPDAPPQPGVSRGAPANGEDLLRRMHDAYADTWYRTVTFVQKSTFPEGRVETWYEAAAIPGKLRIDVAPIADGNATVFRNDSVYAFEKGQRERAGAFVHPLLVLGFDVYRAPVEETIAKVRAFRVDLSRLDSGTWQGRPVWIVGAAAGDTTATQFWVDTERLVFVRMLERRTPNSGATQSGPVLIDTRFNAYQRLAGGWIAPEVIFIVNGRVRLSETYSDMRADVDLPAELFDADEYRAPGWVK